MNNKQPPTVRVICQSLDGEELAAAEITLHKIVTSKRLDGLKLFYALHDAEEKAGALARQAFTMLLSKSTR